MPFVSLRHSRLLAARWCSRARDPLPQARQRRRCRAEVGRSMPHRKYRPQLNGGSEVRCATILGSAHDAFPLVFVSFTGKIVGHCGECDSVPSKRRMIEYLPLLNWLVTCALPELVWRHIPSFGFPIHCIWIDKSDKLLV